MWRNDQTSEPVFIRMKKTFLVSIVFISAFFLSIGKLSYSGFCFPELRYLSEREKTSAAIQYILQRYPPAIEQNKTSDSGDLSTFRDQPRHPISYSGIEQFLKINSMCCELSDTAEDGYRPSFLDRLFGYFSTFVRVRYSVRFYDEKNTESSKVDQYFVAVSSCGKPWEG